MLFDVVRPIEIGVGKYMVGTVPGQRNWIGAVCICVFALIVIWASFVGNASAGDTGYTYDSLGRVKQVTYPDNRTINYSYDAVGNRTQVLIGTRPVVTNKSLTVAYNTAGAVDLAPSGSWTAIAIATQPGHGSVTLNGQIATYTPATNYAGADSFTFNATNVAATSTPATVSINIALPAAPTAGNTSVLVGYNTAGSVGLTPGGIYTSLAVASDPSHGSVTINGTTATYTPTSGYSGTDSFTYKATGPGGTSPVATVSVTVTPPAPVVSNKSLTTAYNTAGAVSVTPSGSYTSVIVATAPTHGTALISGTTATYTPTTGYFGADSFTYKATGPGGTSPVATVSVAVGNPPPPVAGNTTVNVSENAGATVFHPILTGGPASGLSIVTPPSFGSATISGTSIVYTPARGFYGQQTLTYSASNAGGTSSPATLTINVLPPPPVAGPVSVTAPYNSGAVMISALNQGTGGPIFSASVVTQPAKGTAVASGPDIIYTPTAGQFGADSFQYTASNTGGASPTVGTVSVTIAGAANPVANNYHVSVASNAALSLNPIVSAGDSDPNGYTLTLTSVSQPANGISLTAHGGGGPLISFLANGALSGSSTTFTYTISNGHGGSATGTISVSITPGKGGGGVNAVVAQPVSDGQASP